MSALKNELAKCPFCKQEASSGYDPEADEPYRYFIGCDECEYWFHISATRNRQQLIEYWNNQLDNTKEVEKYCREQCADQENKLAAKMVELRTTNYGVNHLGDLARIVKDHSTRVFVYHDILKKIKELRLK